MVCLVSAHNFNLISLTLEQGFQSFFSHKAHSKTLLVMMLKDHVGLMEALKILLLTTHLRFFLTEQVVQVANLTV